jgi:sialate O-acetylesterase
MVLLFVASLFFCILHATRGDILFPSHLASHMVLQQNVKIPFWGLDTPGSTITVTFQGNQLPSVTCDSTGRFNVTLPSSTASLVPTTIQISSNSGSATVTLVDILIGDVYYCSGQSNMELSVVNTANVQDTLSRSTALGNKLRIFSVALDPSYPSVTTPQLNLTASIPWSQASPSTIGGMSALCYFLAENAVNAHPNVPIGLLNNAWGGVAIQVYASPQTLAKCTGSEKPPTLHHTVEAAERAFASARNRNFDASPINGSCLFYSMVYPLLSFPISLMAWYQGESNMGDPIGYQCLQREMVKDYRTLWSTMGNANPTFPFFYIQLAAWPTGITATGSGASLPVFRVASEQTLVDIPAVAMSVAADISDSSGAYHPIHPLWKRELARRVWLAVDNILYGNTTSPVSGPKPITAIFNKWDSSWEDYHFGTGSNSYVCTGGQWTCGGVQITFDSPVQLRSFYHTSNPITTDLNMYGWVQGSNSGFELRQDMTPTAWTQPVPLVSISADGLTVQLNTTWIGPTPALPTVVTFGWNDYPDGMPLENSFGLPVGPFNMTIVVG